MAIQKTRGFLIIAGIMAILSTPVVAGEPGGSVDDSQMTSQPEPARLAPWISSSVAPPIRKRIEASFQVASQRLVEAPECRALFSDLGADWLEMLSCTLYYPASAAHEKKLCGGAWGYTTVGSAPPFLCRKFSRISEKRGATILIHEALHHAGLGEWPSDSNGMTSKAINKLVEDSCGL
jgi:hypothetical protein